MARVAVFFGGRSEEHEVSCVSAVSTLIALAEQGHDTVAVGIDRDGEFHLADPARSPLVAEGPLVHLEVPGGGCSATASR